MGMAITKNGLQMQSQGGEGLRERRNDSARGIRASRRRTDRGRSGPWTHCTLLLPWPSLVSELVGGMGASWRQLGIDRLESHGCVSARRRRLGRRKGVFQARVDRFTDVWGVVGMGWRGMGELSPAEIEHRASPRAESGEVAPGLHCDQGGWTQSKIYSPWRRSWFLVYHGVTMNVPQQPQPQSSSHTRRQLTKAMTAVLGYVSGTGCWLERLSGTTHQSWTATIRSPPVRMLLRPPSASQWRLPLL